MGYWKHALVALSLGQACLSQAQSTFNRRYDTFDSLYAQTGRSVELLENGEFVVFHNCGWQDSVFAYGSVVATLRIDPNGEFVDEHRVEHFGHSTYPGWANASFALADGGFAVGGGNYSQDGTQRPVLYFFDAEGMPTGFIEYGTAGEEWIGRQGKQTPDGGYVICGETSATASVDAFVLKIDASGQQEWVRTYGGQGVDFSVAVDIRDSGGCFLGGEYSMSFDNSDLWVQALNDTGGVVWDKKWGGSYDEPNAHITRASDGHVLVASAWGHGPNWSIRRYLAKLNADDGSIIWERQYGNVAQNYPVLYVVQEVIPGGDLISVGGDRLPGNHYFGVLLRTTAVGDSVWMRSYQYFDDQIEQGNGLLRDVQPTLDGGFIAVGAAFPGGPYSQDVWVIKTDSMGCLEPGCHLIMGIESQITNLRDALSVAPNPVASGASVHVRIDLPESFTPQGPLRLTVTDAAGRLVHELQLSSPAGQLTTDNWLNLQLPTGLYHLHLHDATRWISGAKLVVE